MVKLTVGTGVDIAFLGERKEEDWDTDAANLATKKI